MTTTLTPSATIGFKIGDKCCYALEGSIFNAGTAMQFLRDNFGFLKDASQSENMALSVKNNGGVYFVPAFTGLGAPYWNIEARGVICGLTRDTKKEHVVRAGLEAQAYQTRDLIGTMQDDSGQIIKHLRIDGGLAANKFMCQFLADQLGVTVEIPRVIEATAWGAACLAGVQAGVFGSIADAAKNWQAEKLYKPVGNIKEMDNIYALWKSSVGKV